MCHTTTDCCLLHVHRIKSKTNLVKVFKYKLFVDGVPSHDLHPLSVMEQGQDVGPLLLSQTLDLPGLQ